MVYPVALLLQLQQLSHKYSGLNELIFRPLKIALVELISYVSEAVAYRTSI